MSLFLAFVQTCTFQQASEIKYGARLRDDEVVSQTVAHLRPGEYEVLCIILYTERQNDYREV